MVHYIWDDWKHLTVQELLSSRVLVEWVLYEKESGGDSRKKINASILLSKRTPLRLNAWNRKAKRLKTPYPKRINRY
jgi:hypothetical protein